MAFVAGYSEGALFLFKDFHPYLKDNAPNASLVILLLRYLAPDLKGTPPTSAPQSQTAALDATLPIANGRNNRHPSPASEA